MGKRASELGTRSCLEGSGDLPRTTFYGRGIGVGTENDVSRRRRTTYGTVQKYKR